MTFAPTAMVIDPATGLFMVWLAITIAMLITGIAWLVRPGEAATPLKGLGVAWLCATVVVGLVTRRVLRPSARAAAVHLARAPDFAVHTLDGKDFTRDSLQGKVVLIEFWASWCGPCREALPEMLKLYREYSGNNRFVMIGVSEDEEESKLDDFVARNNIRWQQQWDPKGKLLAQFVPSLAIPAYIVMDAGGRLRFVQHGWNGATYLELRQAISDSLGPQATVASARP
ncbi:MAG TPA: TlpA family protein disulfide reductase [Candidatus Acidoferrales bacterium]|nr:TlpA family protein disulfide reductase [Candidatus Acidoferrales bacterium]